MNINVYEGHKDRDGATRIYVNGPQFGEAGAYNWGYEGGGPDKLAHLLAINEWGEAGRALVPDLYRTVVVEGLRGKRIWRITSDDLQQWRDWNGQREAA